MRTEDENMDGGSASVLGPQSSVQPGLCGTCRMARRITTAKGSTFIYCTRADADPAYLKYPRLPVLACPGFLPPSSPKGEDPCRGEGGQI